MLDPTAHAVSCRNSPAVLKIERPWGSLGVILLGHCLPCTIQFMISSTDADFAWLTDHSLELSREYAGKWIAVHNGEVVGVGDTATEAAEQASAKVGDANFILEALDESADIR